jgi:hypothetical protein
MYMECDGEDEVVERTKEEIPPLRPRILVQQQIPLHERLGICPIELRRQQQME